MLKKKSELPNAISSVAQILNSIRGLPKSKQKLLLKALDKEPFVEAAGYLVITESELSTFAADIQKKTKQALLPLAKELFENMKSEVVRLSKRQRGSRTSSKENIKRNAEICSMKRDKGWSNERLRKKYLPDKTIRALTKILKDSSKWLFLADQLESP